MQDHSPRVMHLSCADGGMDEQVIALAMDLQRRGIVSIIGCPEGSHLCRKGREKRLTVYSLDMKNLFDLVEFFALWEAVKQERVSLLHVHDRKLFWPAIVLKLLSPGELSVVFHRRKIEVIYSGCDFRRFSPLVSGEHIRQRYHLGEGLVVGTVTAMNELRGRGQHYLIRAAALLKDCYPGLRYLFVGSGTCFGALRTAAHAMGVGDRIIFTGYREHVEECIAAMDVFCLSSGIRESFGRSMVEAQSMGKPVIGTCGGGVPETFLNGITGLLVPSEDAVALAQAIGLLIGNRARREEMGRAASMFVRSNFSIESMGGKTASLYKTLQPDNNVPDGALYRRKAATPQPIERQPVAY